MNPILGSLQIKLLAAAIVLLTTIAAAVGTTAYHAQQEERRQVAIEHEHQQFWAEVQAAQKRAPKIEMSAGKNW